MACLLHKNFQADMAEKPKMKSKQKWEKNKSPWRQNRGLGYQRDGWFLVGFTSYGEGLFCKGVVVKD